MMNTEYTKNILPPNSPIIKYFGEWMSRSDFKNLSGKTGNLKAQYAVLFYNDELNIKRKADKAGPTIYAINYLVFKNCQVIQNMNKITDSFIVPTKNDILNLSQFWKGDKSWGFISDYKLEDTYFIGEINDFKKLSRKLIQLKTGKLKSIN